ncbi:PAS domain S-box protein [Candidatus Bathyarchaeota archaeon]|nr:PAS domain S-box protein [Candidatus Bathyarchaeota archaeon]
MSPELQVTAGSYDSYIMDKTDNEEIKVLHIDDNKSLLALSKLMIETFDPKIKITNISNFDEIISSCMKYDLIITDYDMPGANGVELAKDIRDICNVPIIIYTGKGCEEIAEEAFQACINDYIRKELEPAHYRVLVQRIRSVVEKDRGQKNLRKSERKYRLLINNMNEGVALYRVVYNENGEPVDSKLLDVNPSFERIIGMSREEAIGKLRSKLYSDNALVYEEYINVAETGESIILEKYFPSINKHFWISLFSPEKDHVAAVFKDATKEKKLMRELESSLERIRNVLRVSPHAIVVTDIEGYVSNCNDAALNMFGFKDVEDVLGLNCFEFVSEKDRKKALENWVDRINSGTLRFYEYELKNKEGTKFEAIVSGSVMRDEADEPTGFVLNVEDISERKELREYCIILNNAIEERFLEQSKDHTHN